MISLRPNFHSRVNHVARDVEWVSRDAALSGEPIRAHLETARVVVDVGPGIRPQTILSPSIHICVKPFEPYLTRLRADIGDDPRFAFFNATWDRVLPLMPDRSADSVVALDVIERLDRREGEQLVEHSVRVARQQVVVFTPLGFYQQSYEKGEANRWGMMGGRWRRHRSGWSPDDFGADWHIIGCRDFHTVDDNEQPLERPFGAFWAIYRRP